MKRVLLIASLLMGFGSLATDSSWQYGRIVDVRKSVTSKTKAWVVNTPITEEQTTYTIWIHLENTVVSGDYELTPEEPPPPQEWITKYPVKVQIQGDTMSLRSPTGNLRLHIIQRKNARPMLPLTSEEKKRLAEIEAPPRSLIGFSEETAKSATGKASTKPTATETAPQPPPAPPPAATGTVTVRSTPYLSEVFVDGNSMGYTPAKIALPPGKHTFRVEKPGYKPWTKEMTVTVGSELTLEASLEKK